ncbi:MAG TPA: GNAT family N-acetyltransferase [Microthrixaceae bacterium]|nr:GNAT family N-acetyltransferase [Microthrixaceae bacterium]
MTAGSPTTRVRHVRLATLPTAEADAVFDRLTDVVAASMTPGIPPERSWAVSEWEARRDQLIARSEVEIASIGDVVVGFLIYEFLVLAGRPTVLLIAGCVRPDWQSQGIGFALNFRLVLRTIARARGRGIWLVARILNPVALHAWRKQLHDASRVWPNLGEGPSPRPELERAAHEFVERYEPDSTFDPVTGVLKGRHPPGQRVHRPSGSSLVDDFYEAHVDLENGDTVLMVIDGSRTVMLAHAARIVASAPRGLRRAFGRWRS